MLLQVSIRNFAIFKDAVIEPGPGYNVITGESGAGKSIVVNALSLICGARAYREMIRTGETSASVEAVFRVPVHKMNLVRKLTGSDEDALVITREIHRDRSSVCKINGRIRNLSQISELSSVFIDIHGQYENQNLLNVDNHILYLDDYAKKELKPILNEYNRVLNEYTVITNEIISVSGSEEERERNRQILEFQINEINSANLDILDENALIERKVLLENAEKYRLSTAAALNSIENEENSTIENIRKSVKELESLPHNENIEKIIENMNEAYFLIQDASHEISSFNEGIEFNESELEEILERIENLNDLKRKYGKGIDDILEFRSNAMEQLQRIINFRHEYALKLKKLSVLENALADLDKKLTEIRKAHSYVLKGLIVNELKEMSMKDSVMDIVFRKSIRKNSLGFSDFKQNGMDECEFLISLNKGLTPVTLGKVASGGEMSRIMLSFKTVFSYKDDTETVVFDEIDSGISGEASISVAEKLEKLSKDKQIICITHLPQIAARAGSHFVIVKETFENETKAGIRKVSTKNELIDVVASLTDGDIISKAGREHALNIISKYNKLFN